MTYTYTYARYGKIGATSHDALIDACKEAYEDAIEGTAAFCTISKNGNVLFDDIREVEERMKKRQAYFCPSEEVEIETIQLLLLGYESGRDLAPAEQKAVKSLRFAVDKLAKELEYSWDAEDKYQEVDGCCEKLIDGTYNSGALYAQLAKIVVAALKLLRFDDAN